MIKKILYLPVRALAILAGFVFVVNLPMLFYVNRSIDKVDLHFNLFKDYFLSNMSWFLRLDEIPYLFEYFQREGLHKYFYTMSLLTISLSIVSILGILIAISIMMLPTTFRARLIGLINFTTTVPELLIIFLVQYAVVYMYKSYDLKLIQLYGGVNSEPYFLPIIIIIFLPAIFLIQFFVKEFMNEEEKDYVVLAKAKGLSLNAIYFKHIIRNIIPLFFIHLRTIIWFLLSNLIVVEHLLNIHGFVAVLKSMYGSRVVLYVLGLLIFALPIIIANSIARIVTIKMNRRGETL